MTLHRLPGCDDEERFFDVTVLLPVTLRFWADNEQEAKEQWTDCTIEIQGPMHSFSVGFPETLSVKEVEAMT